MDFLDPAIRRLPSLPPYRGVEKIVELFRTCSQSYVKSEPEPECRRYLYPRYSVASSFQLYSLTLIEE